MPERAGIEERPTRGRRRPGMRSGEFTSSLPRPPVWRVLLAESGFLIATALGAGLVDPVAGRSLLCGGLVFLVPQTWFAWRVFRYRGAGAAPEVVQGFYRAEAGKFLLTCAGFAAVFVGVRPLHAAAFFGAYIVLYVVNGILLSRLRGL